MVTHTSTGEWQSFEARMRRRRAERLLVRAEAAIDAGCLEDASECLAEARSLAPQLPTLEALEHRLTPPAPLETQPATGRRRLAAAAVIVIVGTAGLAGWMLVPRSAEVAGVPAPAPASAPARQNATVASTPPAAPLSTPFERALAETSQRPETPTSIMAPAGPQPAPESPLVPPADVTSRRLDAPAVAPAEPARLAPSSPNDDRPAPPISPGVAENTPLPTAIGESIRLEPSEIARRAGEPPVPRVSARPMRAEIDAPAAVPAASTAMPPAPPAEPSQEPAVRSVLERYAAAYSSLDVDAAQRVWPGVNRGALARAFDSLASQQVSLHECRIQVDGANASARCAVTTTWAPKVGDSGKRTDERNWLFELTRGPAGWEIASARIQNR